MWPAYETEFETPDLVDVLVHAFSIEMKYLLSKVFIFGFEDFVSFLK